jgi:predicted Rossmann-fold nucleotide-binding protein
LHIVEKPVGLLNIKGFFDPLMKMLDKAVEEKFLRPEHRGILISEEDEAILLKRMNEYKPVSAEKWIERLKEGKI